MHTHTHTHTFVHAYKVRTIFNKFAYCSAVLSTCTVVQFYIQIRACIHKVRTIFKKLVNMRNVTVSVLKAEMMRGHAHAWAHNNRQAGAGKKDGKMFCQVSLAI